MMGNRLDTHGGTIESGHGWPDGQTSLSGSVTLPQPSERLHEIGMRGEFDMKAAVAAEFDD